MEGAAGAVVMEAEALWAAAAEAPAPAPAPAAALAPAPAPAEAGRTVSPMQEPPVFVYEAVPAAPVPEAPCEEGPALLGEGEPGEEEEGGGGLFAAGDAAAAAAAESARSSWPGVDEARGRRLAARAALAQARTFYKVSSRLKSTNFESQRRGDAEHWEPLMWRLRSPRDGGGSLDAAALRDVVRTRLRLGAREVSEQEICWLLDAADPDGSGLADAGILAELVAASRPALGDEEGDPLAAAAAGAELRLPEVAPALVFDADWVAPTPSQPSPDATTFLWNVRRDTGLRTLTAARKEADRVARQARGLEPRKPSSSSSSPSPSTAAQGRDLLARTGRGYFQRTGLRKRPPPAAARRHYDDLVADIESVRSVDPPQPAQGPLLFPRKPAPPSRTTPARKRPAPAHHRTHRGAPQAAGERAEGRRPADAVAAAPAPRPSSARFHEARPPPRAPAPAAGLPE